MHNWEGEHLVPCPQKFPGDDRYHPLLRYSSIWSVDITQLLPWILAIVFFSQLFFSLFFIYVFENVFALFSNDRSKEKNAHVCFWCNPFSMVCDTREVVIKPCVGRYIACGCHMYTSSSVPFGTGNFWFLHGPTSGKDPYVQNQLTILKCKESLYFVKEKC